MESFETIFNPGAMAVFKLVFIAFFCCHLFGCMWWLISDVEMKEEERHQQALNESSAQRLAMAKEALAAQKLAIKQGTVPPPQPLPPPKSPTKSPPRPTTVNGSCNGSYATQLLSA